jgi:hypothetical protein
MDYNFMLIKLNQSSLESQSKITKYNQFGKLSLFCLCLTTLSSAAFSDRRVTTNKGNTSSKTDSRVSLPSDLKVPLEWQKLIDPTQDDFWNEGNFKPDQGFLIWAKNPTIENAKLFLIRMNAKRNTLHIMQKQQEIANKELIKLGVIANDYDFLTQQTGKLSQVIESDLKGVHIFFLFHPTCSHCKKQAQILSGRNNVTPMQVAGDSLVQLEGLPPSIWAEKEDINKYASNKVVPVLLIYSNKTNSITNLSGVHTLDEIKEVVRALEKKGGKNGQ